MADIDDEMYIELLGAVGRLNKAIFYGLGLGLGLGPV